MAEFYLSAGDLAAFVNRDERLHPQERRFDSNIISQYFDKGIIPDALAKRLPKRKHRSYCREAVEWIVLGTRILRHTFADRRKVGDLFQVAIRTWDRPEDEIHTEILDKLRQMYDIDENYPAFLRRLLDAELELPDEIKDTATPPIIINIDAKD